MRAVLGASVTATCSQHMNISSQQPPVARPPQTHLQVPSSPLCITKAGRPYPERWNYLAAPQSSTPSSPLDTLGNRLVRASRAGLQYARRKTWHDMTGDNLRWYEYGVVISLTIALAFVAGFVNAITLLSAVNMTVSHLTGIMTNAALATAATKWETVATALGMYCSFLVGATSSGVVVDSEGWQLGQRYGIMMIWESLVLGLGYFLYFHYDPVLVLFINAYACGLQNAMGTVYSGAIIRTTHLTGAITDIGIVLGHVARRGLRARDAWKLKFLMPIVCSYFIGCIGAGVLHQQFGYHAISIPVSIVGFIGMIYFIANFLATHDFGLLPTDNKLAPVLGPSMSQSPQL